MGTITRVRAPGDAQVAGRRFRLAAPATALAIGGLVLALMIAEPPLAALAHQSVNAGGVSVPEWFSAAFAVVGFVVAWRKSGRPARPHSLQQPVNRRQLLAPPAQHRAPIPSAQPAKNLSHVYSPAPAPSVLDTIEAGQLTKR